MKLHAQISRMGSHFLGCKKQSLHFSLCGQLLFIIRCKTKVYLPQSLWFTGTHPTFFKRSSNFPTVLTLNDKWLLFKPAFYGCCLSHCVRHDLNARVKYDFSFTRLTDLKVAQYFSARSKYGAHHGQISTVRSSPNSISSRVVVIVNQNWSLRSSMGVTRAYGRSLAMVRAMLWTCTKILCDFRSVNLLKEKSHFTRAFKSWRTPWLKHQP